MRQAHRSTDRLIAGVAGGLAEHLGWSVRKVRLALVLSCLLNGLGLLVYLGLWAFLPSESPTGASNGRAWWRDSPTVLAAVALGLGAVGVGNALGAFRLDSNAWGWVLVTVGGLALWLRADVDTAARRWRTNAAWLAAIGAAVLLFGIFLLVGTRTGVIELLQAILVLLAVGAGLAVGVLPLWTRKRRERRAAREEQIRQEERDVVAAHLHDSVLQTLTLIQRRSDDPDEIARLARTGETSLREWLYPRSDTAGDGFALELRRAAAAIEAEWPVAIEVINVSDRPLNGDLSEVVAAAREAMLNAAKHSQTLGKVQVFAEFTKAALNVFVRDRGRGFEPAQIPADRHGIRNSIIARMARIGGEADIRSAPGEGTEVRLTLEAAR